MRTHHAYFEASNYYEIEFTEDQIFTAYHQGDCEQDAIEVSKELELNIPRSELITALEYYGAWETEELEGKSTEELKSIVTWLLAGQLHDEIETEEL
jgi:hypothetical protein